MSARRASAVPLLSLACALVVATGAGLHAQQVRVDFSETPRSYVAKDYEAVYERWTRHEQVLEDTDVALEVWATFKSWEFREAFVERYASIYSLSESDHATLRAAQQEALRTAYEFHVNAQSTNFKWNDLEKANTAWRTTLIDALGHELEPESIKIVKLPDAFEREFFPRRTPFLKSYAIRFVAPADTEFAGVRSGTLTLRIVSPIGRVELEWRSS